MTDRAGESVGRCFYSAPPIERTRAIAADLAEKVLSQLPPDDRLVLLSIDGEQLQVKDVAEMTGWSESKVKSPGVSCTPPNAPGG